MLTAPQRRVALGCSLLLAIALTVIGDDRPTVPEPAVTAAAEAHAPREARMDTRQAAVDNEPVVMAKLSRVPPDARSVDVFASKSWSGPRVARVAVVEAAPPPVAPPLPFTFSGRIEGREGPTFLIARDAESFSVHMGEQFDPAYRLEAVEGDVLTFLYLPLNERQTLNMETGQ